MKLAARNESEAFLCQDADHIHSRAVRSTRRIFLGRLAALGAGALFADQSASAEAAVDKPFRIDVHHHLSSPGFIAEISGRRTGQVPLMKWTVAQSIDDMDQGGVATAISVLNKTLMPMMLRTGLLMADATITGRGRTDGALVS